MPRLYLAQRVWESEDLIGLCWNVPHQANARGAISLRSVTASGTPGPTPTGHELVVYDGIQAPHANLLRDLGDWNPERRVTTEERDALATATGKRHALNLTVQEMVEQYLTDPAFYDPSGRNFWKPLTGSRKSGVLLRVGGLGDVLRQSFVSGGLVHDATVEVFRADYTRLREAGEPLNDLRKWTGYMMLRIVGQASDSIATDLLPDPYKGDGWLLPTTTVTDAFTDTNGTALTSHNDSGGNAWVNFEGSAIFDIQSNQVDYDNSTGVDSSRQGTTLSSPDHTIKINLTVTEGGATIAAGLWWRKDGTAAITGYMTDIRNTNATDTHRAFEVTTGTFNQFASSPITDTPVSLGLLEVNHNSSDLITIDYDGVENYNETDTTHTSGNYGGIRCDSAGSGSDMVGDSYSAVDDAAGGADVRRHIVPAYRAVNV